MSHPPFSELPALPPSELEARVAASTPEELLRSVRIVLGMTGAFWERDFDSGATWYSPTFFRVLGLPENTHEREKINARIHPDDLPVFERAYSEAIQRGGPFHYDVRFLDHAHQYRWARASGRVWLHPDGRPQRLIGMMVDVHAEREAQLALLASEAQYRRALAATTEAHFERTVGTADFLTSYNLAEMMGHPPGTPPPDEATFASWLHPDDRHILADGVRKAQAGEGDWEATYRIRQYDGSYRWFRGRGRTFRDEAGVLRMTGMLGDVHQQVLDRQELDAHRRNLTALVAERTARLDAALQEAQRQRAQAEEASRAKSEFLAHMSHELRTPLNGMLGMAELALRVATDTAQLRYLDAALSSGKTLLRLIDDVLDYARSEAQAPELEQAPFDLAELLAEVMRSLMPSVRPKGLRMLFDWTSPGDSAVIGDATRVRQVVTNLIGNACKYTASGLVSVTASLSTDGHGQTMARVRVQDTGSGIDPARTEAVFEPFVQADASLTRDHGGAGLGLAIARRWARAMGGDVKLASTSASGSTFDFAWPAALPPYAGSGQDVQPGQVWLLCDPPSKAQWLQARFQRLGWTSLALPSIAAAIEQVTHQGKSAPLVMLTEQVMGRAAGLAELRAVLPQATIVLLVRPDWHRPDVEAAAAQARMSLAVPPLTPRDLQHWLRTALPPPKDTGTTHRNRSVVLVVEDHPVNRMVAEAMLSELGMRVHCAEDGLQALAVCEQFRPDLVLMDLQMPVMDGLEATRRLRALQAVGSLPAFPIVALTAHVGEADRQQALTAGIDDYITKPVAMASLEAALRRWLPANTLSRNSH
jgi:signal transduction histidine kinase/CheY-like chemotaxis protein